MWKKLPSLIGGRHQRAIGNILLRRRLKNALETRRSISTASKEKSTSDGRRDLSRTKSFVQGIFTEQIHAEQCFPFPDALSPEQEETVRMLVEPTERFFSQVNDPLKNDELETVEEKSMEGLREMGCFGIMVPVEYGGLGLSNTQYCRLGQILGAHDLGVGIVLGAHQSIGYKGIVLFGNDQQKAKYLPDLAAGKKLASYCLTEPSSGSDAQSIRTQAELSPDGRHYILNGNKLWISNGGLAEVFTVFAKTPVKVPATGETREKVTAFIVERSFGGVTNGPPEKKMGIRCSNTAQVHFDNTPVPVENVLGGVGGGFKVAMEILNNGRFGMASALSGTMKTCIEKAVEHAKNRVQFGSKLHSYQGIQEKIARMVLCQYVTESMAFLISANMDLGAPEYQLEAAISKVYAADSAWYCCDEAIQILGGMGFMRELGLEKIMRDLRIFRIFEGTNDILKLFVALTGMQGAGSHLRHVQKAVSSLNLGVIAGEGAKRARRLAQLERPQFDFTLCHPALTQSAEIMQNGVADFGSTVEKLLIRHGKGVVHQQAALNRVAAAAIDLYSMVAVISRASRAAELRLESAESELLMAELVCQLAGDRVQRALQVARSKTDGKIFDKMSALSQLVVENDGLLAVSPVGF